MQLEAGKKYTDRRGRVYGPMVVAKSGFFGETTEEFGWYPSGKRASGYETEIDLVAEYVEPVQPVYRMLNDGETVHPDDQFLGYSGEWEKVPQSGNVFDPKLYFPHRRLMKPAPVESWYAHRDCSRTVLRVCDGRLTYFEDGVEGGSYCAKDRAYVLGEKITAAEARERGTVKVEQPAPVESPDDWVTQDRVPARPDDRGWWTQPGEKISLPKADIMWTCKFAANAVGMMHGDYCSGNGFNLNVMCRRKDLPPVQPVADPGEGYRLLADDEITLPTDERAYFWRPNDRSEWNTLEDANKREFVGVTAGSLKTARPDMFVRRKIEPAEPEFPQYYVSGEVPWAYTAYVVRRVKDVYHCIGKDGEISATYPWGSFNDQRVTDGHWKRVTQAEAVASVTPKPKTRTVVLKEWLCWDNGHDDVILPRWSTVDPSKDNGSLCEFDHAHATGNIRTVEIPVT